MNVCGLTTALELWTLVCIRKYPQDAYAVGLHIIMRDLYEIECVPSAVVHCLHQLDRKGFVNVPGTGRSGHKVIYTVTPAGNEVLRQFTEMLT